MAILKTDTAAQQAEGLEKAGKLLTDGSVLTGAVLNAHGVLTVTAADATSDVVNIVRLPSDVWFIPEQSSISVGPGGAGASFSFTVGKDGDLDLYSAELDASTAGTKYFDGGAESFTPVKLEAGTWIKAELTSVTTPVADAKIKFSIAYKAIS